MVEQASNPVPKRSWFWFSLLVPLLAMLAFAIWLGLEAKTVRERQSMRAWIEGNGGRVVAFNTRASPIYDEDVYSVVFEKKGEYTGSIFEGEIFVEPHLSRWRRFLDDRPQQRIALPASAQESDIARTQKLFPELLDLYVILLPKRP